MRNRLGKVEFISQKEISQGYLLRETKSGVRLEKYYDDDHINVDVVAEFEGARIDVEADFDMCITEARKYVGCKNTTIHIDLNPWNAAINQQ